MALVVELAVEVESVDVESLESSESPDGGGPPIPPGPPGPPGGGPAALANSLSLMPVSVVELLLSVEVLLLELLSWLYSVSA